MSPDGLVLTNHHCAHSCIEQLSTAEKDLVKNGYTAKTVADWENAHAPGLTMLLGSGGDGRLAVVVNRSRHAVVFHLPARPGHHWTDAPRGRVTLGPRAVAFAAERPGGPPPTRRRNRASTP